MRKLKTIFLPAMFAVVVHEVFRESLSRYFEINLLIGGVEGFSLSLSASLRPERTNHKNHPKQTEREGRYQRHHVVSNHDRGCHSPTTPSTFSNTNCDKHHGNHKHSVSAKNRTAQSPFPHDPAMLQVEHRATEKAGFGIAHFLSEKLEELSENLFGHVMTQASERSTERMMERPTEHFAGKAGETVVTRALEGSTEEIGARTIKLVGKTASQQSLESTSKKALERADSFLDIHATNHASERPIRLLSGRNSAARSSKRLSEHINIGGHSVSGIPNIEQKSSLKIGVRAGERAEERGLDVSAIKASSRTAIRTSEEVLGRESEVVSRRLSRGVTLALPVVGGFFALYLLRSDFVRIREEVTMSRHTSCWMFAAAAAADFLDAALHFFIAYLVLSQDGYQNFVTDVEQLSMTCAIVSTVAATLGESISQQKSDEKMS